MKKYIQRSYHTTSEDLRLLAEICEDIGAESHSAAIRYCIRQIYKQLQQESA